MAVSNLSYITPTNNNGINPNNTQPLTGEVALWNLRQFGRSKNFRSYGTVTGVGTYTQNNGTLSAIGASVNWRINGIEMGWASGGAFRQQGFIRFLGRNRCTDFLG